MRKRKICVVTGTRAEYGLLYWLMKDIQNDPDLVLQIIATGMHLSPEYGYTYKIIEDDGFHIDEKLEMLLSSDTVVGVSKSIGLATIGFADALNRLKPDIIIVLGDRYEVLAASQAAMVAQIPIAHIHGGETTEGVIDEAIRHSITKMSHLHFVAAESYRRRVIQLGEDPERVFNFGAIGLDYIDRMKLLNKTQIEEALNTKLGKVNFLVTYHPVTLDDNSPQKAMNSLFNALKYFREAKIFFTKPNSDAKGKIISKMIDEFCADHPDTTSVYTSLGQLKYLSLLKAVDIVIGNSSSGLIEAPALKTATINLGERQRGRLRASSVIDCREDSEEIINSIQKALSREFRESLENIESPYRLGNASYRIKEIIKNHPLKNILKKKFYDLV